MTTTREPPQRIDLREWRCNACGRLLLRLSRDLTGTIEVKCPKCGKEHTKEREQAA